MNYRQLTIDDFLESTRQNQNFFYRVATIRSGSILEAEVYPVFKKSITRAKKTLSSRKAQQMLNDKNACKQVARLINANFTDRDIAVTLTYDSKTLVTETEAKKDIQNYIRRVKNYRQKIGLLDFKYIYVIESGAHRVHYHIVMNETDRDIIEKLWNKGYANCKRLQSDNFGYEALARYIIKERSQTRTRRWSGSKNLKQPKITIADKKITKRSVLNLAKSNNPAEIFENIYKGYKYNKNSVKINDVNGCIYLAVHMKSLALRI